MPQSNRPQSQDALIDAYVQRVLSRQDGAPAPPPAQPGGPAPSPAPSPDGEITAGKGFLGRLMERARIPTTAAGWSDPMRAAQGAVGAFFAPISAVGETVDTAGDLAGRARPVSTDLTTPAGGPSLSAGTMAEFALPGRLPLTTPGALKAGLRGAGGIRNFLGSVQEGINAARVEGQAGPTLARAIPRPLPSGTPPRALPAAAGPSATGSARRPSWASASGLAGPDARIPRRPTLTIERSTPSAPSEPVTYGRPASTEPAPRPAADLGRDAMAHAESTTADLEPATEFINRHRGMLQGPQLAQFVQLTNQYNRAPDTEKSRLMMQMFKLVKSAAAGTP